MSDLPNRDIYADMARKMLGLTGPETEEEAEAQQREQEIQQRGAEASVALEEAKAAAERAKSDQSAKAIEEDAAKIEKLLAETASIRQDMRHQDQAIAANGGKPHETKASLRW